MDSIRIGDREVGPDEPTFVIAEAGSNHNGDFSLAKDLVDAAADAGADAVKFQTFRADEMYVPPEETNETDGLFDTFKSLEMPYEWIPELAEYCESRDILFVSTPFDERSAAELDEHVPAFKVASLSMSHYPFLEQLAEMDKPLLVSTGSHEQSEVAETVEFLRDKNVTDLVLLQCVTSYPTPLNDINVRVVETFQSEFDVLSGLSDHTTDPTTAPASAVSLGAAVVEKHFTLDNSMEGPDHSFALEPGELEAMVSSIRKTEQALGTGDKRVLDIEEELYENARRAIQAVRDITSGEKLTERNVAVRRPGDSTRGMSPRHYENIIGRKANADIERGEGITTDVVDLDSEALETSK